MRGLFPEIHHFLHDGNISKTVTNSLLFRDFPRRTSVAQQAAETTEEAQRT